MVVAGSIQPYWKKEEQFLTTAYTPATATTATIDTELTKVTKWIERDYLQGVMLNVKARVNDRNEIYLLVTPMLTDIVGEKQTSDGQVSAPITVTRQATTLLKVHDGDIVVLGGLRGKKLQHNIEGIPGLMENKLTGTVTSNRNFGVEETELVMIIRAKLVY
jgi:type II secretory pathway component GspD/PulD (secretin)